MKLGNISYKTNAIMSHCELYIGHHFLLLVHILYWTICWNRYFCKIVVDFRNYLCVHPYITYFYILQLDLVRVVVIGVCNRLAQTKHRASISEFNSRHISFLQISLSFSLSLSLALSPSVYSSFHWRSNRSIFLLFFLLLYFLRLESFYKTEESVLCTEVWQINRANIR